MLLVFSLLREVFDDFFCFEILVFMMKMSVCREKSIVATVTIHQHDFIFAALNYYVYWNNPAKLNNVETRIKIITFSMRKKLFSRGSCWHPNGLRKKKIATIFLPGNSNSFVALKFFLHFFFNAVNFRQET